MPVTQRTNHLRWGMVGLLMAAFALRAFALTHQSLWRDEVDALRFATAPWREMLNTFTQPGWNGPLYFVLLRGWVALTGQSEFALRYLSLLLGVVAVALAFALCQTIDGCVSPRFCAPRCSPSRLTLSGTARKSKCTPSFWRWPRWGSMRCGEASRRIGLAGG